MDDGDVLGGDPSTTVIPLSGLIGAADGTPYPNEDSVADYSGALTSSMMMRGVRDTSAKNVAFRVGVRAGQGNIARPVDVQRVDTSISVSEPVQRNFQEMGRRSSAMPVTWERIDLHGVIKRLAQGAAYYSAWGVLTTTVLRGGGAVSVASIEAVVNPVAADAGAVFVSAKACTHHRSNIMAAFANAISGEGGTMYTDLLAVNVAGVAQVPDAQHAALAQGCHEALRMLGALYKACGKGCAYAYAVTEGIHRVLSVHGHSDEGAFVRDVMRTREAGVPYGAIQYDIVPDNALPSPGRSVVGFRCVYHAIAIATAGAVALCDPMVDHHGRNYPTVLVTDQGDETDPGSHNDGDDADSIDLTTQWAVCCGAWASNYARALGEIFVTAGGGDEVVRRLSVQASSLAGSVNRHMRYKVAVAFSWVEPTGSCPVGDNSYPAFVGNHGPLCTNSRSSVVPALDGCVLIEDRSDSMRSSIQVDFRYARRHGLFVHLSQHDLGGMANIVLESAVVNHMMLVGGAGNLGPRVLASNTMDSYMWGRGHSCIVSGGELMSLSQSNVITMVQTAPMTANGIIRNTHLPHAVEAISEDVTYRVSRLVGTAPAAGDAVPERNVRRCRARAAVALSLSNDAMRAEYVINQQLMRPSLEDYGPIAPAGVRRTGPRDEAQEHVDPGGNAPGTNVEPAGNVLPRTGPAANGGTVNGLMVPITVRASNNRGPRPPPPPVAGRVGGRGRFAVNTGGNQPGQIPAPGVPNEGGDVGGGENEVDADTPLDSQQDADDT